MFELTKSQRGIQKAALEFAKGEFDKELAQEIDRSQQFPEKIWRTAGDLGFIGMHYPEEFYGQSLGMIDTVLVIETLCRKDSTLGSALALAGFAAECILKFGVDEIKEKFLPSIAEGKLLCGAAPMLSNPEAISLFATPTEDGWCVSGYAYRVINGGRAGCYCLLCNTDKGGKTDKSLSMFLVPTDLNGVATETSMETLGLRMTPVATLHFDDIHVPGSCLLGKPGDGFRQYRAFENLSRLTYAAMALGTAQGAQDRALDYIKQREQFGKKIVSFQVSEHKIADMATKIEQARFLLYQAAGAFDQGQVNSKWIAMAKISACRAVVEVSSEAVQLMGGYGYASEYEVERCYRDAKTIEIFPDAPLRLKDDIAKSVIGKIRK